MGFSYINCTCNHRGVVYDQKYSWKTGYICIDALGGFDYRDIDFECGNYNSFPGNFSYCRFKRRWANISVTFIFTIYQYVAWDMGFGEIHKMEINTSGIDFNYCHYPVSLHCLCNRESVHIFFNIFFLFNWGYFNIIVEILSIFSKDEIH